MTLLGIGLALAAAAAWMLFPLWRPATEPVAEPHQRDNLEARHRQILLGLQDLDFELQTGKLSPEDHQWMRGRIQTEAVEVLRQLEKLDAAPASDGPTAGA